MNQQNEANTKHWKSIESSVMWLTAIKSLWVGQ